MTWPGQIKSCSLSSLSTKTWPLTSGDIPTWIFFATWYNHKCLAFVLPTPNVKALDTDALTIDWEWMFAHAFLCPTDPASGPAKVQPDTERYSATNCLVLAKADWFLDLLTLSGRTWIPLPPWDKLLKQSRSNVYHQKPRMLNIHAWRLPKHP